MVPATLPTSSLDNLVLLKLAREIAIGHHTIETILGHYKINTQAWESIQVNPRFTRLLESEITAWNSALNTMERTKLKAGAVIEEWLEEANSRLHDGDEGLNAKVELGKLLARIAGMGLSNAEITGASAERFSVTINLGTDQQIRFEKDVTPKVIEAVPNE